MTVSNTSTCPNCGGKLKPYDKVSRLVRTNGGEKNWVKIRRLRCVECRKLHRELPDFLVPYKHYDANIIESVLDGSITSDMLEFEDFPSEMTMTRWTRKKHSPL